MEKNSLRRFFSTLGPGLVTGASGDDPSGIGTYAQAGAALGLATLWTALFTFPMMWSIQVICAKIGMVTGSGLAPCCESTTRHSSSTPSLPTSSSPTPSTPVWTSAPLRPPSIWSCRFRHQF